MYADELDAVLRYSSHEAIQKAILNTMGERFNRLKSPRAKSYFGPYHDLIDRTQALAYADLLADEGHPAEHVIRWFADPERAAEGDRVGMRGMFVGPANTPKSPDGLTWYIGHGRKTRLYPKYPLRVGVSFHQPGEGREQGFSYGHFSAPVSPDEADALAAHIDRFYDGKHPIAGELREAANRYRKRR